MMKQSHQKRGFTLIETMVAVTILTFAIAGPLTSASRATVAAQISRDRLTASYLAQEGIEYVRAMRDDAFLAEYQAGTSDPMVAWGDFISGSGSASIVGCKANACTLDPTRTRGTGAGLSLVPCSGASCTPLYIQNGVYTQQSSLLGAERTPFTRTVRAYDVTATEERIVSTVSWSFHAQPYSITTTDHLTPWQ